MSATLARRSSCLWQPIYAVATKGNISMGYSHYLRTMVPSGGHSFMRNHTIANGFPESRRGSPLSWSDVCNSSFSSDSNNNCQNNSSNLIPKHSKGEATELSQSAKITVPSDASIGRGEEESSEEIPMHLHSKHMNEIRDATRILEDLGVTNAKIRTATNNYMEVLRRSPNPLRRRRKQWGVYSGDNSGLAARRRGGLLPPVEEDEWGEVSARLRIKSVHAAHTLDVVAVLAKVFGGTIRQGTSSSNEYLPKPLRHVFHRSSVIVQLPPSPSNFSPPPVPRSEDALEDFNPHTPPQHTSLRYVAIFRFGSVVFFNVSTKESGRILEAIKKHGTDQISAGFERKEHYGVVIQPGMEDNMTHVTGDYATLKELDMNAVAVISTIMAQTVALDSYSDIVDELLSNFASINSTVKRTGNFTAMERDNLFKVVAQNNSIFIDMVSKLGIKDRSDTAWNLSQYDPVHESLKGEFEIERRFDQIEFKLNLIQQNAKFFLEVMQNQKSSTLEWIIIVLIAFECGIMILDMSGLGSHLMEYIYPQPSPVPPLPTDTPK